MKRGLPPSEVGRAGGPLHIHLVPPLPGDLRRVLDHATAAVQV